MTYKQILNKPGAKVLITGDSISYNRYSYDDQPRINAFNCGVGMPSWSFRLRDKLLCEGDFVFGDEIEFNCKSAVGIDNACEVPNTAAFNGRVATLYPETDVKFKVDIKSETIVLYLQTRIDNPCSFDVYLDGDLVKENVDTKGDNEFFAGYSLEQFVFSANKAAQSHVIEFKNIKGCNPKITVAGVGTKDIKVDLTGKGSQMTSFFIENFEERIGKYNPDLMLIILTANDRGYVSPEVVRKDLLSLFSLAFNNNPNMKILFMLPQFSHFPSIPDMDSGMYTAIKTAQVYNKVAYDTIENIGKPWYTHKDLKPDGNYDIDILPVYELFDPDDVKSWRFDNIHLNQNGNNVLFDKVCKILEI